jgi:hypothetical protein
MCKTVNLSLSFILGSRSYNSVESNVFYVKFLKLWAGLCSCLLVLFNKLQRVCNGISSCLR